MRLEIQPHTKRDGAAVALLITAVPEVVAVVRAAAVPAVVAPF